jgi:molecular chaperone DnaK (HSP70)
MDYFRYSKTPVEKCRCDAEKTRRRMSTNSSRSKAPAPKVQAMIQVFFSDKKPNRSITSDAAVALV